MSDQQFEAVLTAREPEPRTRVRINHSRTIKETHTDYCNRRYQDDPDFRAATLRRTAERKKRLRAMVNDAKGACVVCGVKIIASSSGTTSTAMVQGESYPGCVQTVEAKPSSRQSSRVASASVPVATLGVIGKIPIGVPGIWPHEEGPVAAFDAALKSTEPEPRTRIRVNHSRTQRDGWQYETAVEVEFSGISYEADTYALDRLGVLLNEAREIAIRERDLRNAESPVAS